MVAASQLRAGTAIRFEGQLYKVLVADYHAGQGRMGGAAHTRLKNLTTGTLREHSFRAELKLEEVDVHKTLMDFLYEDSGQCNFMNPETFEQMTIPAALIGPQARLLQPEMRVGVEFVEGNPVSVLLPEVLEVRIAETAPPSHQQVDSVWKPATLESGVEILVPQFIKTGDVIRLDVANLKYMDRAKGTGRS
jgi:elongation factor P